MLTIHGIPNCDTVKKARRWLDDARLAAHFHDFRKDGVPAELADWVAELGWERLLNRAGTSFRALPDAARSDIDAPRALALMQATPAMIKRPVLTGTRPDGRPLLLVGFRAEDWAAALTG